MKTSTTLTLPTLQGGRNANKWRKSMLEIVLGLAGVLALVILLVWIGLQIRPAPFPPFPQLSPPLDIASFPPALPPPVARFYHELYGDTIPVIKSAVITGHADVRPAGPVTFPARFRFTHLSGQGYRHYIEAGLFGLPMMQVDERYLDGHALGITPFGVDQGDKVDQAANLGLWAETLWTPAVFLTDPRVAWQPVDENTAILVVPFKDAHDRFVVRFDPETGLVKWFESMRYQNQASKEKILWLNKSVGWSEQNGILTNTVGAAIWMNDGKPWAVFYVDDIRLNVDVQEYIRAQGP